MPLKQRQEDSPISRYINPVPFIQTVNGAPVSGAKLYFYETGTTTLKTIYSDSGFTTATTNPQVADSSGRYSSDIFLNGIYAVVQKDANDVTIWSADPVGDIIDGQFESWTNDNTYAVNEIVLGSDGEYYISLAGANQGNDPTTDAVNWELFYLNRLNYKTGTAIDDDDIDGSNILTLPTDGDYFTMTGTQQIDGIATVGVGRVVWLQAGSSRTLTHDATNLILIGGDDIDIVTGDVMAFYEYATGDWRMLSYDKASGNPIAGSIALGTPVASTSGTSIDFTSIPAGTKKIIISLNGVSTNGTSDLIVQLGDAGGVETSGYSGGVGEDGSASRTANSSGFIVINGMAASSSIWAVIVLVLENSTSFSWMESANLNRAGAANYFSSGAKSLSAELDRVRITTTGGTDAFDAGEINIQYE